MRIRIEVITPKGKRLLDAARIMAEIERARAETSKGILDDFKKTVATWDNKPDFYSTRRGNDFYIGTKDKIYGYVDLGTRPHAIKPKKPEGRLRFYGSGFKPKSRVGYIASYGGRRADSDLRFPKAVHHPGNQARRFSEKIAEKWRKEWNKRAHQAIRVSIL